LAARQCCVGIARPIAGVIDLPGDDGVERRVVALGARDKEVEQLEATDAPVADFAGQSRCRSKGTSRDIDR
jgi:hypothetical protein